MSTTSVNFTPLDAEIPSAPVGNGNDKPKVQKRASFEQAILNSLSTMQAKLEEVDARSRGVIALANGKVAAPPAVATEAPKPKAKGNGKAIPETFAATYQGMLAFTQRAIRALRAAGGNRSKGIHTAISGYNAAFREQFNGADPVNFTRQACENGDLQSHPCKRGAMLYLPGEMPASSRSHTDGSKALATILGS